jgi:hypothetical protein
MFKIGGLFLDVSIKLAKISISNINQAFLCLMTYQANLYLNELSLGFVRNMV